MVHGGYISHALGHLNLSLLLLHQTHPMFFRKYMISGTNSVHRTLPAAAWCMANARHSMGRFRSELLRADELGDLPRVFFCSMSWVSQSQLLDLTKASRNFGEVSQDHTFSVIKRFSLLDPKIIEYQVIQGYVPLVVDATNSYGGDPDAIAGYSLNGWQSSSNIFSPCEGFNTTTLLKLLGHLDSFVCSDSWNEDNHFAMFHQRSHYFENKAYIPGFQFRELQDDHIIGMGDRPLIDAITATMLH
jgi:hypothetical protein